MNLTLTYDVEDRITNFGGAFTAGYRDDGLRAWKHSGSTTIYFLYDGSTLLAEIDGATGNLLDAFGYGVAGLTERHTSATTYAYTFDPSGNLVQRVNTNNQINGQTADFTAVYDGFGAQLGQISPGSGNPFPSPDMVGFGGQWGYYTDNETAPVNTTTPTI